MTVPPTTYAVRVDRNGPVLTRREDRELGEDSSGFGERRRIEE
jgi:hypothetical protein